MDAPWWQTGVVYQIYPRSFADADGDGVGDLEGIRQHLDHLEWLGVDALWLSPIFPSPMADFGYDVTDYCDVDPLFGDLDALDRLVADAHARGIRIVLDWVPNHTSDEHPWFVESRSSTDNAKRDWYVWRDGIGPGRPPNDWSQRFAEPIVWERNPVSGELEVDLAAATGPQRPGSAWTFDEASGQWYLHLFLEEQPDLDWTHPGVEAAGHEVLRFWLDRGIDGIRADVVVALGKDVSSAGLAKPEAATRRGDAIHQILKRLRTLFDGYDGDRMLVGEVFLLDIAQWATYYGQGDELHLGFNFTPLFTGWTADAWRTALEAVARHLPPGQGWPSWVLSNHDLPRHADRYGSPPRARAAAVLLLTLRGTPFLYAGEELGLLDAVVAGDRRRDPGGRDGSRAPIPWLADVGHGWAADPWLPFPPDADRLSVESQQRDESSMLHLYRDLLRVRRSSSALQVGDLVLLDAPAGVLAYDRVGAHETVRVVVNFRAAPVATDLCRGWSRVAGTHATLSPDALRPDEASVLAPLT